MLLDEKLIQRIDLLLLGSPFSIQPELLIDRMKKLNLRNGGIENIGSTDPRIEVIQEGLAKGGLPSSNPTDDLDKALSLVDTIAKVIISLLMASTQEEVSRIRRQVKWIFDKAK